MDRGPDRTSYLVRAPCETAYAAQGEVPYGDCCRGYKEQG